MKLQKNKRLSLWLALAVLATGLSGRVYSETITPESAAAWEHEVREAKADLTQSSRDSETFFWINRHPGRIEKVELRRVIDVYSSHGGGEAVHGGLVHHWIGDVFIPDVRVSDALAVLQNYDAYADVYKPAVVDSRLLSRKSNEFTYRLKFVYSGFGIKTGLSGQFRSTYTRLDSNTGFSVTESTHLAELKDAGTPYERELTTSQARGYVERTFTILRYRQADGGLYVEVETVTLSRGVPASIRWIAAPLIQRFSKEAMESTLCKFSDRVQAEKVLYTAFAK